MSTITDIAIPVWAAFVGFEVIWKVSSNVLLLMYETNGWCDVTVRVLGKHAIRVGADCAV